jgi:predicted transposase YbfD/YdcC
MVTLDAMGCHKDMAQTITPQGADDVLALQAHQGTLYEDVPLLLAAVKAKQVRPVAHHTCLTVEADHGRGETRASWITSDIDW